MKDALLNSNCIQALNLPVGRNPFDGFTPSVPVGTKLDYGSQVFQEREDDGMTPVQRHAESPIGCSLT